MDIDIVHDPLGTRRRGQRRLSARHLAVRAGGRRDGRRGRSVGHVPAQLRRGVRRRRALERAARCPRGERFAWDESSTYVRLPPYFEGMPAEPEAVTDVERRARARAARRQRHDRPHLAGRLDQARQPRRALPAGAGRRAARLQLLRLAPRQPRGDDARHVREHPPAQPARRRREAAGRRLHALPRRRLGRADVDLRRRHALHRRRHRPRRARRHGVRLGLLARLGRQGHAAARRARGDRRELRAHPPLEPGRHGRAAAAVRRRRERRLARADRRGDDLDRRAGRGDGRRGRAAARGAGARRAGRRRARRLHCPRAHRHAAARPTTSATAASCSTCCAGCSPHEPRAEAARPPRRAGAPRKPAVPPLLRELLTTPGPPATRRPRPPPGSSTRQPLRRGQDRRGRHAARPRRAAAKARAASRGGWS